LSLTIVSILQKVLTNIEYRAVSGVFQNIDPPTPLHAASVYPPPFGLASYIINIYGILSLVSEGEWQLYAPSPTWDKVSKDDHIVLAVIVLVFKRKFL
jgi:hypothetical protein